MQVAARRAAVRARLPRRSWAGIISYMYRTSTEPVDTVRVFGPRLNSKYIDKNDSGERARMQKTWNKCTPLPTRCAMLLCRGTGVLLQEGRDAGQS